MSRKTGYVEGERRRIMQHVRGEEVAVDEQRVIVTPETYVRPAEPITVEGADVLRRFLGLDRG